MFGSVFGNIFGIIFYLYFQVMGFLIIYKLFSEQKLFTKVLMGSVLGHLMLQWLPVLFALCFGFTKTGHILSALVVCIIYVLVTFYTKKDKSVPGNSTTTFVKEDFVLALKDNWLFVTLSVLLTVCFIILLSTHTLLPKEDGSLYTGQACYGDMSMHLGFITSIARQPKFPFMYSISPTNRLSYPFMCDSISSSIYIWGSSLRIAYIVPMVTAFIQVLLGVYLFAKEWLLRTSKAIITYVLFFLNGGLGIIFFVGPFKDPTLTLSSIFNEYYKTPTNLIDHNIRWVNIIVDMLLPQRSTLFGYALLFTCILLLYKVFFKDEKKMLILTGIFVGLLPMINTHSFLAAGMIMASWSLMFLVRELRLGQKVKACGVFVVGTWIIASVLGMIARNKFGQESKVYFYVCIGFLCALLIFGIVALIIYFSKFGLTVSVKGILMMVLITLCISIPQLVFWTFKQVAGGSGFNRGFFNWGNINDNYFWFYLKNWGVVFIILLIAIVVSNKRNLAIISGALLTMFVSELIVFTPNSYDNNKLIYVAFLFFVAMCANLIVDIVKRVVKDKIWLMVMLAIPFFFITTIAAVLSIGREIVSEYQVYNRDQVEAALFIENNIENDAVFLTSDRHLNEMAALAGRNIVQGSYIYIGMHGVYNNDTAMDVRNMFEYPADSAELFVKHNVDYIVVSSWERGSYNVDEYYFNENYDMIFSNSELNIYKVR